MKYMFEDNDRGFYLVAELEQEQLHAFVYPMLINSNIPGILIPSYEMHMGKPALVYSVQGYVTMSYFLEKYANRDDAWKICGMLRDIWRKLDEYMIPDRCCIWNKDNVYVNPKSGDIGILCIPVDSYVSVPLDREAYIKELERIAGVPVFRENNGAVRYDETGVLYSAMADEMQRVRGEARMRQMRDESETETTVLDSSMCTAGAMSMQGLPVSKKQARARKKKDRKTFAERRAERKEQKRRKKCCIREMAYQIPGMQ